MDPKKRIVFLVNPISGTNNKQRILNLIAQHVDGEKFDWEIIKTEYAGHATVLAQNAATDRVDAVVAVGGDGTINEVARSLTHTNTALGIIPCGSGNGLARHLLIPMQPQGAIAIINKFLVKDLDYGIIDGKPFFCTCGVGFDAFVSYKFAHSGKRGLFSYIENTLREGIHYEPETYDITIDNDKSRSYKAFLIACANASQYGNNAYIAPHATLHDGLMDVTILEPFHLYEAPRIAYQLFKKSIDRHNKVRTFQCKKLHIRRNTPGVLHFDGDPIMADKDIEIRIIEQGLKMVVNPGGISTRHPLLHAFNEYYNDILNLGKDMIESGKQMLS